jgi:hypothetical protein
MAKNKISWTTEKRKISDLSKTESNPRILTDKQYKQLKRSIDKFDLAEIPAINTNNKILAGHMRLELLKEKHGEDFEIDVRVPNRELTKKEADEYLIRSNKNTGEWDFDVLANNFDMNSLLDWGFTNSDLCDFDLDFDKEDEKPEKKDKQCPECGATI